MEQGDQPNTTSKSKRYVTPLNIEPCVKKSSLSSCHTFILFYLELELERYKFVVQVVIGELRGEGVK